MTTTPAARDRMIPNVDPAGRTVEVDTALGTLLLRISGGDLAAYETVYRTFKPRMLGLALRLIKDRQLAEDATHDALLQVWTHSARYDPAKGGAVGWLMRLVHARSVDRIRKVVSATATDQRYVDQVVSEPGGEDPAAVAVGRCEQSRVRHQLSLLPPAQAQVLALAYYGNQTMAQIAASLQVPLGTVKWRCLNAQRVIGRAIEEADR